MDKVRVCLLANKEIGSKVYTYLSSLEDTSVVALFAPDSFTADLIQSSNSSLPTKHIYVGERLHDDKSIVASLPEYDFIISVFWPFLLKDFFISTAHTSTINFHPAFLPYNRGWYPHVFNIIEGTPAGVSLHEISSGIDTGAVWVQKLVPVRPTDTSSDLYFRLVDEIFNLFVENWPEISNNNIRPLPQTSGIGQYNSIKKVSSFDEIDLQRAYIASDLINLLRARTFAGKSYAYFTIDNKKYSISVNIEEI